MQKLDQIKTKAQAATYLYDMIDRGQAMAVVQALIDAFQLSDLVVDLEVYEISEETVDAAAEVMWNDRDARMGGAWSGRSPNEIAVIQTKATAKAALLAAAAASRRRPPQ